MSGFLDEVEAAAEAMREVVDPTPLQENAYLSRKWGARIFLKREDLTPVRSYKLRGAFNFMRKALAGNGTLNGFVCASAGNHAQGFAFACRHFGKRGTVFMPVTTPQQKIDKTRMFGGEFVEIELVGDFFEDSYRAALAHAGRQGALMVPPFDHPDIIEGQASVGLEILQQLPPDVAPDMLVMPVGGGGLSAGVARIIAERYPQTRFVMCEPAGAPSLKRSLELGRRVALEAVDNFVDGAAVAQIGEAPFAWLKRFGPEDVQLIPENRLCATMIEMLNIEGIVLEPAGALAIDALKDIDVDALQGKNVVLLVSGGNFDFERLPDVKERALRFEGLKKYFVFRFPQRPGALRDFLRLLGPEDDITRFEYLKKSARNFGSVLIGIETRSPQNFDVLLTRFREGGWAWQDITDNDVLSGLIV